MASFLSRLITSGINVYIISVLTHTLRGPGYGEYVLVFVYLAAFAALADLGLYAYLVRYISQVDDDQERATGAVLGLDITANIVFLIIACGIALLTHYPPVVKIGFVLGTVFVISTSLIQIATAVYQKHVRMADFAIIDVLFRFIHLVLVLGIAQQNFGMLWFVGILSIVEFFHAVIVIGWMKRFAPFSLRFKISEWVPVLKESYPMAISLVLVFLYFKFDSLILSFLRPPEDVAVYSLAYKIIEAVIFIPAIYIGMVMPQLSRAFRDSVASARTYSLMAWDVIWLIAIPCSFGIAYYAPEIISLFAPEEFAGAVPALRILSVAMIAIFLGNLGGNGLIAAHKQKTALLIYACAAILSILLNLILIPKLGYIGTSITTVVVELFVSGALFVVLSRCLNSYFSLRMLRIPLASSMSMAILLGCSWYLSLNLWFGILFCALLYIPLVLVLRGTTLRELRSALNFNNENDLIQGSASS